MTRYVIVIALFFSVVNSNAQEKPAADWHNWNAPYHLAVPDNWTMERFPIPISFAPTILYKGVEDIRFTPGWAKSKSEEYWTYAFLWYLEDSIKMDAVIIAENLKAYYTGLLNANTDPVQ